MTKSTWLFQCRECWSLGHGEMISFYWLLTSSLLLQLKEDMKKQKEAACFKARPNTVMYQEPFVPKKEHKMLSGRVTSTFYTGLADSSELMQFSDVFLAVAFSSSAQPIVPCI